MTAIISIPGFSEPFSSISHLLAAMLFSLAGLVLLFRSRGSHGRFYSISIFVFTVVFLLSMSGVFHLLEPGGEPRSIMRRLDHAAIFTLIAGTFTPIHILLFSGWRRWSVLAVVWFVAIAGISVKTVYFNELPEWVGLTLYLSMGWIGALSAVFIFHLHGGRYLVPLIAGAIAYTVGAVLEFLRMPTLIEGVIGPHELFHIFVVLGIGFHWLLIAKISEDHRNGVFVTRRE
ncbi:MAG: DNA-binding protein [Gammaproteobacteria bacterium]|nr:DNA-binding protein [Gammaproteobacteria bacterium]